MTRQIVKDAFKCDALVYQFEVIDLEDGLLKKATPEEVSEKYGDAHIIADAENRLDICNDEWNQEDAEYVKEAKQLRRFLKKWGKK